MRRGSGQGLAKHRPGMPLTPRQREALRLVACGLSNRQIARVLGWAEHSVKVELAGSYVRLGCRERTTAAIRLLDWETPGWRH